MNVTADLRRVLRDRHPPPDWCMAFEIQIPGRNDALQFADAIAFDTRKGAGMAVHGFELKVSRSDWLTEVKDPSKAAAARALCDYWWVVIGDPNIAVGAEVPPGVGLLAPDIFGVLRVLTPAAVQKRRHDGLDRPFVAALLRRLDPMEPRAYYEGRERRAEQKGYAKGRNEAVRVAGKRARSKPVEPPVAADGSFCP